MSPEIPVSWGELVDKITILKIKSSKILNSDALKNINKELSLLTVIRNKLPENDACLNAFIDRLAAVNKRLWDVEDRLREKEMLGSFDDEFIFLARSVYKENDLRAAIKKQINDYLNSEIIEEKSYTPY